MEGLLVLARKKRDHGTTHAFDIFKSTRIRSCMPVFYGQDPRNVGFASSGAAHVIKESGLDVELVPADKVAGYDLVLVSMLSCMDAERMMLDWRERPDVGSIIIGGQGCVSIRGVSDLADVAHFGRAEGAVQSIIDGEHGPSTWTRNADSGIVGSYAMRPPQRLLDGEVAIGCRNRCTYCQYTYTRPYLSPSGAGYANGSDLRTPEEDWRGLEITGPGRYTTALDGWSDETRQRVLKHVRNAHVREKMLDVIARGWDKPVVLKVFQIVGYPWETPETVKADIAAFADLLKGIDADSPASGGRVLMMICHTPFSPEPLTPMQHCPAQLTNWRAVIDSLPVPRQIYAGKHIEAFCLPQIPGPFTLAKRCAIQRGCSAEAFRSGVDAANALKRAASAGDRADEFLRIAGNWISAGRRESEPSMYLQGTAPIMALSKRFSPPQASA